MSSPIAPDKMAVLVVGLTAQAGKSTAAAELGRLLDTVPIATSTIIAQRIESTRHWPAGTIEAARALDSETFRQDLIDMGDLMEAEGRPAAVVAIERGHRVVEGIRVGEAARLAMERADQLLGVRPVVLCLERPDAPPVKDNTKSADLLAMSDVHVLNDGTKDELNAKMAFLVGQIAAGKPLPRRI